MNTFELKTLNPISPEMAAALSDERHGSRTSITLLTLEEISKQYGWEIADQIKNKMNTDKLLEPGAIQRVAEEYTLVRDQFLAITKEDLDEFRHFIQYQFAHLSTEIYFDFVDVDPYEYDTINAMREDFILGTIKVNTSGNDSFLWGKVYNLMFRAIHDFIHVYHNLNFTYEDEVYAFEKQIEFSKSRFAKLDWYHINWPLYEKILRSEIIYQAAYKTHYKVFHLPEQKIILDDL